jgi:carbonic anhydrase/acetyltransferase-like protein (isoleucine patch superfamily)
MTDLAQMKQHRDFWVSRLAVIVGDVQIASECSIWHFTVLRGDVAPIRLGPRTVVQDASILHCQFDQPLEIEGDVVIGHKAVVHCRWIGKGTLIGIGAIVLDGARIGRNCIIAAGSLIPPDTVIPDGKVVMGVPGEIVRDVTAEDIRNIESAGSKYIELARQHTQGKFPRPF